MKTPMRAHSPPINCTLEMVKLVMGMVVMIKLVMGMVVMTMEFMKLLLGKLDTSVRGPICPEPEVSLYTL